MTDILYVIGSLEVGGTERHLSLVLPQLAARGWRVEVAVLERGGPFERPLQEAGIAVTRLDVPSPPPVPKLAGLLRLRAQAQAMARRLAERPRLLHCFLPMSCIIGGWAAQIADFTPLIMSRRSQAIRPALFMGDKWLERRALQGADRVLAHSTFVLDELRREGIPQERLGLVHNGVSLSDPPDAAARKALRGMFGWRDDEVVLAVVANLIAYKGHGDLLQGLTSQALDLPNAWRLVLIGSGSAAMRQTLRDQVRKAGLEGRVDFLGSRDDVAQLLAAADVGVLASHHEGFSNAILEYMAAGLPVVATATGGNLDAVADGETGFLVPVADPSALGLALAELICDPDRRRRMGRLSHQRAKAQFSLETCVDRYEAVYREVLAQRKAA